MTMSGLKKLLLCTFFLSLERSALASVKSFDDQFSLAAVVESHAFDLFFSPLDKSLTTEINYRPNTTSLSGFQASYKGLTLAYLRSSPFTDYDLESKGKTSYEDFRGGIFLGEKKNFVLLGYYNRYKGFYIQNTSAVDPASTSFLKAPTMETFNSGASLMYVFSPGNFSAAAAFVQSDQQTMSGGSWLAMASFDTNILKNIDGFVGVPTSITSNLGVDANLIEGKFATSSLSIGYAYTLVWNYFYINATALIGYGLQARTYTVGSEEFTGTEGTGKQSYGLSLGYNGDSFFATAAYVTDSLQFETRSIEIRPAQTSLRMNLGFRF